MHSMIRSLGWLGIIAFTASAWTAAAASDQEQKPQTPAQGYNIHITAPHQHEDGSIRGPMHHYCKPIPEGILQCLLFNSTDPKAKLVEIEYFIDKSLARDNVSLLKWNRYFHDHKVEVETGRVKVLDVPPKKEKELLEAASKTDGIIFRLWPEEAKIPNGKVSIPTSIGHKFRECVEC